MNSKETVKAIMEEKKISNADMAGALNISQAAMWDRLNNKKTDTITVSKLNEMLRYLGYDLVIMPRGKANRIDGTWIVEDAK